MLVAALAALATSAASPAKPAPGDCPAANGDASDIPQLRNVWAGCSFQLRSPDAKLELRIDAQGRVRVSSKHDHRNLMAVRATVEPPALAGWSPKSNAFLIDDGGGGSWSDLRVFVRGPRGFVEERAFNRQAVGFFRSKYRCRNRSRDPDMRGYLYESRSPTAWGYGFSPDGRRLYVHVENGIGNLDCGFGAHNLGMVIDMPWRRVIGVYPEDVAKRRFPSVWPRD